MVQTILAKRGYEITTVRDGQEAYDSAIANVPDLIIADIMMPRLDGWALVKMLRSRSEFALVPVIFLTALSGDDDRLRGFRLGADDYVPKPFRFEEFDLRVAKVLRHSASIQSEMRGQLISHSCADLAGRLDKLGLPSLLSLLELERKSGVVVVRDPERGGVGRLSLRDGRVVQARVLGSAVENSEDCVYELLQWTSGSFEFTQEIPDVEDDLFGTTSHLLLESARRIDEKKP